MPVIIGLSSIIGLSCHDAATTTSVKEQKDEHMIRLITIDPGHFHAALLQKSMYPGVDSTVHVYAPEGPELQAHLNLVKQYNTRSEAPTAWKEEVFSGPNFLQKMFAEKAGNVVVIAGNNQKKTSYIKQAVDSGFNVLADKPMAINTADFNALLEAFASAEKNKVLLYDIMTERYEINSILQKEFMHMPEVFGELEKGSAANPAIIKQSVHHFFKSVSGKPLVRPSWFFDVSQQGDGIVDVTTHVIDLIQWSCFPGEALDYKKDINMLSAKRWATALTPSQFKQVTQKDTYPDFLKKDLKDSLLEVFSNGEMNYTIKGVHAKVSVTWNFQAPEGGGDTHFSILRGSKASLIIRQGKEQQYKPVLYIEPIMNNAGVGNTLQEALKKTDQLYPGVTLKKNGKGWEVVIPEKYRVSHEEHFAQVTAKFLQYLKEGKLPDWEVPNMIAKYYTTTQALQMALEGK